MESRSYHTQFLNPHFLLVAILLIVWDLPMRPEYFRHLNLEDGLSSTSVYAITQDKLGRMWFATKEGINLYDGVSIRSFKGWVTAPKTSPQAASKAELIAPKDKIWIGNEATAVVTDSVGDIFFLIDNDVVKFSLRSERFTRITDSGAIRALASHQGEISFAGKDSIFVIDRKSGMIKGIRNISGIKAINHLSADNNYFYLSTPTGLRILGRGNSSERVLLPNRNVYSTFLSRNGTIWIPTVEGGLYQLDSDLSDPVQVSVPNAMSEALGASQCRFATEDHRGKIWYGSFSGLYCYNPKTGASHQINLQRHLGGLTHPSVYGLYFDNNRNLWVSTYYGGVNYFSPANDKFLNFNYDALIPEGMAHSFIKDMVVDNDGNLWFASDGAGVGCLDQNWNIITHLSTRNSNAPLRQNNARTIEFDRKRNLLYIGTYMGGLSIYDLKTRKITNLIDNPEFEKVVGGIIHKISLHDNKLFISSAKGLSWMDTDSGKITHINVSKYPKLFYIDKRGDMYCSSTDDHEVFKITDPTGAKPKITTLIKQQKGIIPNQLCITDKGLLIGTLGSGIVYLPNNADKPILLNTANHRFPDDYVYGLCKGKGDVVYATTKDKIVKINMADLSTQSLNFDNYFPGSHIINKSGLLLLDDDEIVVGSTKGISFINPNEFSLPEKSNDHPEIYFSRLRIQNRDILPDDGSGILKQALPFSDKIKLPHNTHDFTIIIGLNGYSPSTGVTELEYMMDGVDEDWLSTTNNEINYRNLHSGSYKLRVRRPGGEEISLAVEVATPWYNQWWAWLLYIAAASTLAFVIIRKSITEVRLRKMLNEAELEREQLEKVNQILRGPVSEEDIIENPNDRKLVESVTEIINQQMDNSELDILHICREIGMSRSLFFNKFKTITGLTPKTFILNYRLKHAATLLIEQPHLSVAEIAYQSGFSTAAYFSRCFKKQFGVSPLSYRKDIPATEADSDS